MHSDNDFLETVATLHEGVADPHAWERAMARLSGPNGDGVLIRGQRKLENRVDHVDYGLPGALLDLLFEERSRTADMRLLMPWMVAPVRSIICDADIDPCYRPYDSAVYQLAMKPYGLHYFVTSTLERTEAQADYFVALRRRSAGPFQPTELATWKAIVPHIARAFRARRLMAQTAELAEHALAALDRLDKGIVLARGDGSVRFANKAAVAILADADGLGLGRSGLRAARSRDAAALDILCQTAIATGKGKDAVAVGAMAVSRPSGRAPYAVVAEPLAPSHSSALDGRAEAGAIIFIGDGNARHAPTIERLRAVYELTQAEATVARSAFTGESAESVATDLGVSVNTVKTHLKSVYAKVGIGDGRPGVGRHAALVSRLAADLGGIS